MLQFIMEHENTLLPGLALKLIQKLQQLQTQLSCFLRKVDENWFLNTISCPLRNALTVII